MTTKKTGFNRASIHGILPIDKPYGITSMDVVRQIKKVVQQKKVGHTGTLDPFATGVIPICIGQATRLTEFLMDSTKEYTGLEPKPIRTIVLAKQNQLNQQNLLVTWILSQP